MIKISFNIADYQRDLLAWYKHFGRHDLPWQGDFNPYYVWLSEIMLQQTQVTTVIPYFTRFIESFPKVTDLAKADQDVVMQHWAGLGYYARARNLHKSAKIIANDYQGIFPNDFTRLIQLPGIGRSTANAILSIAFNQARPILDGNVKRVFARLFAIDQYPSQQNTEKQLWQIAHQLMPDQKTQAYTQAQMDLGATLCTRTRPKCSICPLQSICQAYHEGMPDAYPIKKEKKSKPIKTALYHLYQYKEAIFLIKRPNKGIWGGLYTLPESPLAMGQYTHMLCDTQKHSFTHFDLFYEIKAYTVDQELMTQHSEGRWVDIADLDSYAMPAPFKKLAKFL
ncbi:A/G-specific adenine glycosylase [Facilibium subflavum]|uniref:A/G-specific adenine glycosylase n=1 Tax=Facilibium subflavum TaxID=2219058 RepID=UPI000E65D4A4|nr:A/G-specific adenine glycosylase [Facilibium subflavum]